MSRYYRSILEESTLPISYLLDTYGGASVAYSFRKLSSTYSGNCIRVRRSSDNSEMDIGFVSNSLDTTSLLSFVGSNNGFVTLWYDQSGNNINSYQSNATYQPSIVISGNLILVNSQIAIDCKYNSSTNLLINMNNTNPQATFITMKNELTGNDGSFAIPFGTLTGSTYTGIASNGDSSSCSSSFGTPSFYSNNSLIGSTRANIYTNVVTGTTRIMSIIDGGSTSFGRSLQYGSGFMGNYKVMEIIIYNNSQSSNRSNINTNINNYYSVY